MENFYESLFIIEPNIEDEEVEKVIEKVKGIILGSGGSVIKTENWGRRKLTYEIKKQKKGNFVLLLFRSSPTLIREMEKFFKLSDAVLKFMIVKLRKKEIKFVLPKEEPAASDLPVRQQTETLAGDIPPVEEG